MSLIVEMQMLTVVCSQELATWTGEKPQAELGESTTLTDFGLWLSVVLTSC